VVLELNKIVEGMIYFGGIGILHFSSRDRARSHGDELDQVVLQEGFFNVGQAVEHLDGSLGVTDVEDLVLLGLFLDEGDVCGVIIETHLGPGPVPVLVLERGESLVTLTVLSSSVVAKPDVIAKVSELEGHWEARLVRWVDKGWLCCIAVDPGGSVLQETVLDKDRLLCGGVWLVHLSSDMERGQDVAVLSGDFE